MDERELEGVNDALIEFGIRESIQDTYGTKGKEKNSREFMTIMAAIHEGDVITLQVLSGCVSAFTERDCRNRLPLHAAAVQPKPEILCVVLEVMTSTDVTLEEQTEDGDTALTLAAEAGRVENVRMLLRHGASPHNANSRNESPLLLAVRRSSYDIALCLILGGAFVEQICLTKWTATHEAAKAGCPIILKLLLRHGAKIRSMDVHGMTPLGIAAECGNAEALDVLIQHGGDVKAQSSNGDTVLYDASGSGNLDCIKLLLMHGANPNVASDASQLPIHRAAYEGHILALRTLIPITTLKAIRLSGQSPVHSAADGGHVECLELLIQNSFDVNTLLAPHVSENYMDLRRSPLFFAVSNGDPTCSEMLLAAGAKPDLDPLQCILVAVRAGRYELAKLLLSYGANVNCYMRVISDTVFPTALQYCLGNSSMLELLLNSGYQAYKCFQCCHSNSQDSDSTLFDDQVITFCEFVSVSWLTHLVGGVVRMLLEYVSHIRICSKLRQILERRPEWNEIDDILRNPRSLQHLCRLVIRGRISLRRLNNSEASAFLPFPPGLKNYLAHREYKLQG